jgi:hypothetical protein
MLQVTSVLKAFNGYPLLSWEISLPGLQDLAQHSHSCLSENNYLADLLKFYLLPKTYFMHDLSCEEF